MDNERIANLYTLVALPEVWRRMDPIRTSNRSGGSLGSANKLTEDGGR